MDGDEMNNGLFVLRVEDGCQHNITVIDKPEKIIEIAMEIEENRESSDYMHSVLIIPADLFPSINAQTNANRALSRLISIRRHLDCKIIFISDKDDRFNVRIGKCIADENIIS